MPRTSVRWTDDEQLSFDLPQAWQILGRYVPRTTTAIENLSAHLAQKLEEPRGRCAFSQICARAKKVALVIDDSTRPTPAGELLGPIIAALEEAGICDEQITGVVAAGLHPPMSQEQLVDKVGADFARRFTWVQNDSHELGKYVNLGTVPRGWSKKGLTVYVLKEVARADLVVLFSSVSPHLQAGFGGGFKLVLPGCAHSQTIGNLHKIGLNKQISRLVGQQPSQNRMRQTVERGGDLLGDKVYSVSAVLDSSGQVCELGFGDPGEVQKQLSLTCEQNSGLAVEHTADVAIVSAFPRNYDLLQGLKCLVNTRMAARKRGILIGMMNLRSPGHLKLKGSLPLPMVFFRLVFRLINARFASAVLGKLDKGLDAEAKFFIRLAVETIKRNRVLLYCPGMVEEVDQLPTVEIFDDLDSLWARAEELLGKPEQVRVNVFAEGGTSYPRRKLSHNI